jgi:hypothetical protein
LKSFKQIGFSSTLLHFEKRFTFLKISIWDLIIKTIHIGFYENKRCYVSSLRQDVFFTYDWSLLNIKLKFHINVCLEIFQCNSTVQDGGISTFYLKKIWCASWARVNLPHISNKKCIKIVLQRNLLKNTQGLSFFSRNLYRRYRWDVKYQKSECLFLFLEPKKVTKSAVRFILHWNFINKTQV